jgi:hypothetical protein
MAKTNSEELIIKSSDLGGAFIQSYFANHKQNVLDNAQKNANVLLDILASKIQEFDKTIITKEDQDKVNQTFNSPDFSKLLEQSIKTASISEDEGKKDILSQLIIHRLYVDQETTEALVIKIASEKLEYLNGNHLNILGLIYAMRNTSEHLNYKSQERNKFTDSEITQILVSRFKSYMNVSVNQLELEHLEFHTCIHMNYGLQTFLVPLLFPWEISRDNERKDYSFFNSDVGYKVAFDWTNNNLQAALPSLVGNLLGQYVYNMYEEKSKD